MATVGMKQIVSGELPGGGEHAFVWNNPPFQRTWQITVVPSIYQDTYGSTSLAQASVTWFLEQERTGFTGSGQTKTPVTKRRIRIRVKNLVAQKILYSVFLSWVKP